MSTSTVPTLRAALASAIATQLTADGTTGVTIHKYKKVDPGVGDLIILGRADATQEHETYGGSRDERYTLGGKIYAPISGGSDVEAAEAETRAYLILASIENTLRDDPTVSASVFHAELVTYGGEAEIYEAQYVGELEFAVEVTAII